MLLPYQYGCLSEAAVISVYPTQPKLSLPKFTPCSVVNFKNVALEKLNREFIKVVKHEHKICIKQRTFFLIWNQSFLRQ